MQKLNIPVSNNYFSDKIATFDFDQFYTKKEEFYSTVLCGCFLPLFTVSYILAYDIPPLHSLILTLHDNLQYGSFYTFFYILLPRIFEGGKIKAIVLLLLSIPFLYLFLDGHHLPYYIDLQ